MKGAIGGIFEIFQNGHIFLKFLFFKNIKKKKRPLLLPAGAGNFVAALPAQRMMPSISLSDRVASGLAPNCRETKEPLIDARLLGIAARHGAECTVHYTR
jgi:hypothetical protein